MYNYINSILSGFQYSRYFDECRNQVYKAIDSCTDKLKFADFYETSVKDYLNLYLKETHSTFRVIKSAESLDCPFPDNIEGFESEFSKYNAEVGDLFLIDESYPDKILEHYDLKISFREDIIIPTISYIHDYRVNPSYIPLDENAIGSSLNTDSGYYYILMSKDMKNIIIVESKSIHDCLNDIYSNFKNKNNSKEFDDVKASCYYINRYSHISDFVSMQKVFDNNILGYDSFRLLKL